MCAPVVPAGLISSEDFSLLLMRGAHMLVKNYGSSFNCFFIPAW
jgi:hypothetical protein